MKSLISLRIAFKSLKKNKVQALVSIIGLGLGLGSVILISMLYMHEVSFNNFIPDNSQVYRVLHESNSHLPFPFGETVKNEIPAIDDFFRYHQSNEFELKQPEQEIIKEGKFACADPSIYHLLGINFVLGKPAESINEVAISEKMASKYFADENPINRTFEARLNNDFMLFNVCGVYKDLPSNATLDPRFIAHTDLMAEFLGNQKKIFGEYGSESDDFKRDWNSSVCQTYIKLKAKAQSKTVQEILQKYQHRFEDEKDHNKEFSLQALSDVYLNSNGIIDTYSRRGNKNELKYFIAIALFILMIAVVNYIFLTKAKMDRRFTELGIKKVFGAQAFFIRIQLLFEANFIAFLSLIPALAVVIFGTPFVNSTLGRTLDHQILLDWYTIPLLLLIPLFTGTLSGLFVATKISSIPPILLLNRKLTLQTKRKQWTNSFLSLHFAIFIILLVGVMVLKKQIDYSLNNFKAINPENVIICELNTPELALKFDVISDQVKQMPGVIGTAGSSFIPPFNWTLPIRLRDHENNEDIVFDGLIMGKGMTELLDIEMVEGNHFEDFNSSETKLIFNESAAAKYNFKAGTYFNNFYIQGIAKDFTAHSMRNIINPMVIIQQHPSKMSLFAIKTRGETDDRIKSDVRKLFKKISPDKMVVIYTLKEQISQFYIRENNQSKLISAFSILAIFLSLMGLLGIVMNTVSRRSKEIAIRKVNGANIKELLLMLNMEYFKWILIAFVMATPVSYYVMSKWLESFAYKTDISWWIFALAGLGSMIIALLAVSGLTYKAARQNPVKSLRHE